MERIATYLMSRYRIYGQIDEYCASNGGRFRNHRNTLLRVARMVGKGDVSDYDLEDLRKAREMFYAECGSMAYLANELKNLRCFVRHWRTRKGTSLRPESIGLFDIR